MSSKTSPKPAYLHIAEELRTQIMSGQLPAGTRLGSEAELVRQFNVSRSTVREALRNLASQHLVVTTQGAHGGTTVAEPTVDQIGAYMTNSVGLLASSGTLPYTALLEARSVLEVPTSRLAAERRSDAQLADLRETLSFQPSDSAPEQQTRGFHLQLLQAASNPVIELMARPVFDLLRIHYVQRAASQPFWTNVKHDHQEIFEAVADQDGDAAAETMRSHIADLIEIYESLSDK